MTGYGKGVAFASGSPVVAPSARSGIQETREQSGKGDAVLNNRKIIAEVKSLNSKNLDISTRVAPAYADKDLLLRQMVADSAKRGKIELTLRTEDSAGDSACTINTAAAASYVSQIKAASRELGIGEPQDWWAVLGRMPGITTGVACTASDEEWAAVQSAVSKALDNLHAFRRQEGEAVQKKFEEKLRNIAALLKEVEQYEPQRTEKIRQQLVERLDSLHADYDRNRLEEEMIYYIEKLDINEEKQRLTNHLRYFSETMAQDQPQGKKLGFIAQEIGREVNTLGSKSNHAGMQRLVVRMKDELEQIKEQVLNVL
ncbi:MAG: YicC family protein [Bacteroidaceae bacterium]|nr:YicC family protein [Bacteroidaceae bacterium]